MEEEKVTPEYIKHEVDKAVAFYQETIKIATKFYEEQIDRVIEFHKNQCDRYFEHNIPMVNSQIDAMERAFGGEFSAWNDTVHRLRYTFSATLANLAVRSTEPLSENDHPSAQFVTKTSGDSRFEDYLKTFQQEMLDRREDASKYREKEREEIQNHFREMTEKREQIETAAAAIEQQ